MPIPDTNTIREILSGNGKFGSKNKMCEKYQEKMDLMERKNYVN